MPDEPQFGQLTPKQLELRKTVLGGTDAAAILGVSRSRTAWDVWAEKMGFALPEGEIGEDAMWGLLLEPVILAEYARREEVAVRKPKRLLRFRQRHWAAGHVDGLTPDRVVEVKTRRSEAGWGEPGTDEVPPEVKIQSLHYLLVTRRPRVDVAVLFRGQRMAIYTITPAPGVLRDLLEEESEWWAAHIEQEQPPPYDGDPRTTAAVRARYRYDSGRELVALPAQYGLIDNYRHNLSRAAFYTKQAEELKQTLMGAMEDASVLLSPDMKITWKAHQTTTVGWKEYAADLERLIEQMANGTLAAGLDPLETQAALRSLRTSVRTDRFWRVTDTTPAIEEKETG